MKVEAIQYGDRKVYSVAAFNRGVASWLERLPTVWIEGEVTERRQQGWQSVFFTLKDPEAEPACRARWLAGSSTRCGSTWPTASVCTSSGPGLFEARGTFRLRALTIERFGLGAHLRARAAEEGGSPRKGSSARPQAASSPSCRAGSGS